MSALWFPLLCWLLGVIVFAATVEVVATLISKYDMRKLIKQREQWIQGERDG